MSDDETKREQNADQPHLAELKQIAIMYHRVGNSAKALEIMGVVRDMEKKRAPQKRRKDAA